MLLLTAITDKLQVVTNVGSGSIDVLASFTDRNQSTGVVGLSDRQLTSITGAATTDIVAAPGATTTRVLNFLAIRNLHATQVTDVIVQYNANSTIREIVTYRLFPNDFVVYTTEKGWSKVSANVRFESYVTMGGGTQAVDSQTQTPILGCSIPLPVVKATTIFCFEGYFAANVGVATTGIRCMLDATNDGAANPLAIRQVGISTVTGGAVGAVLGAGTQIALGSAPVNETTGPVTGGGPFYIWGYIQVASTDPPLVLTLACTSEVAASNVIVKEGAYLHIWEPTS